MSLYALGDLAPVVADDAWVAPGCYVIGRVVLGQGHLSGSAAPCAAITRRSMWAQAQIFRKTAFCTLIWAILW